MDYTMDISGRGPGPAGEGCADRHIWRIEADRRGMRMMPRIVVRLPMGAEETGWRRLGRRVRKMSHI